MSHRIDLLDDRLRIRHRKGEAVVNVVRYNSFVRILSFLTYYTRYIGTHVIDGKPHRNAVYIYTGNNDEMIDNATVNFTFRTARVY